MGKDLTLEAFASKEKLEKMPMYVYSLTSNKIGETYKIIRGEMVK